MAMASFFVVVVVLVEAVVGGGHIMPLLRARGRDSPGFVRFDSPK